MIVIDVFGGQSLNDDSSDDVNDEQRRKDAVEFERSQTELKRLWREELARRAPIPIMQDR